MKTRLMMLAAFGALLAAPAAVQAQTCDAPPVARCSGADCASTTGALAVLGNITDPKTGRSFFLDMPCDLKAGEEVTFILNLHGAGSIGNWQRHYFPAADYKDQRRLVIATPTAATETAMWPGGPPVRRWDGAADDAHLQNITEMVFEKVGLSNIAAFWLAGHSQGGFTSSRIVCSDFFKDKVDGWLSLSGGRIGQAPFVAAFGPPLADGSPPPARTAMRGEMKITCDISHIFAIGEHEIESLPETSPWAEKYACGPRVRRPDVVDDKPGHVWDYARSTYKVWGLAAAPGTAEIYAWPGCQDGRVVADVVRINKGHTEGLEPKVTEAILDLIQSAPGGKARQGT